MRRPTHTRMLSEVNESNCRTPSFAKNAAARPNGGASSPPPLAWLLRRLSRMYWQEVPYRAWSVVRGIAQSKGTFDASIVPQQAADARWGSAWCASPGSAAVGAEHVHSAAQQLLDGHLEVFGHVVPMPGGIPEWNTDPVTGTPIETTFGLFIDFRHLEGVDIKFLWEVNRHLWWVPLAQGFSLGGDRRCLERLGQLL